MILNFQFSNFRSFKDECVFTMEPTRSEAKSNNLFEVSEAGKSTIQLLKVSAIFGANASGKTNVMRFLYRFKRWVLNQDSMVGQPISLYDPFVFDDNSQNQPCTFSIEFITGEVRYNYKIEFNFTKVLSEVLSYSPNGRSALLFEREIREGATVHFMKPGSSVKIKSFSVFPNQLLLSKFVIDTPYEEITRAAKYLADITVSNGFHEDWQANRMPEYLHWLAADHSRAIKLNKFLAYVNTGLIGFEAKLKNPNSFELDVKHKLFHDKKRIGERYLPFIEESFGTRSLFMLGCSILQSLEYGTPLFVDEIDSGLHSYITRLILDIFKSEQINKKHSQLIFTTHDVSLLDQDRIRKDQIWFVEKDEYGCSELYSLSDFEDVRENTPFAKWYMERKFGGVPVLKSLEQIFVEDEAEE